MVNVHLYPSPFLSESRILREAATLSSLALFEAIELVGTGGAGLAPEEPIGNGIRIRRFGLRREERGLLGKLAAALRWSFTVFRRYRNAPLGCINCHSVATLPLGCALKWWTGAPLVYDAHELETETAGLRGVRKIGTKIVERLLIRHADYAVFVGAAIERWYRQTYGLRRTAVVYNAPRLARPEAGDPFRAVYPIPADVPIFVYQGVLAQARGIRNLADAFAGLDGVALVLMGYGDLADWARKRSRRQANLFHHAAVPPDEVLKYTCGADYGLSLIEPSCLSYEYCMPNKLFEYLMAGLPVLVSPTSEQRAFVEQHGVGTVTHDTSVESIRAGVRELMSKDLRTMKTAVERTREAFCWERQEPVLRAIYLEHLELCAAPASAP